MNDKKPYRINTSDGSHSIYNPSLKETYHSSHGAITESEHVFINAGLHHFNSTRKPREIKLFEVGFGTGLNALLSSQWSKENKVKVTYHSIEQFPLEKELYSSLNYGKLLGDEDLFINLHSSSWNTEVKLNDYFILKKIKAPWTGFPMDKNSYDIIFYDAFAPGKQPEMWSQDLIRKCVECLSPGGLLTTYCAQGQFKRNMISAGFEIEILAGPPGKKEMVRGSKGEI